MSRESDLVVVLVLLWVGGGDGLSVVQAAGSSLLCPLMEGWGEAYSSQHPAVAVRYNCTGSGTGKAMLKAGEIVVAGSDSVLSEEEGAVYPHLQMLPLVGAQVAVIYNLPGVTGLVLHRRLMSDIFAGRVVMWNDTAITNMNPTLALPPHPIEVVGRADGSGTTEIMTTALNSFGGWEYGVSSLWQLNTTVRPRSSGVEDYVKSTPYTISYSGISSVARKKLPFALVVNRQGRYTSPRPQDGQLAMDRTRFDPHRLNASLADAVGYPIMGLSYLVLNTKAQGGCDDWVALLDFVYWLYVAPMARSVTERYFLVHVSDGVSNNVLRHLWSATCRWENGTVVKWGRSDAARISTPVGLDVSLENLGMAFHRQSGRLLTFSSEGAELNVIPSGLGGTVPSHLTTIPFAQGMLVVVANLAISHLDFVMQYPLDIIRDLFDGTITSWGDRRLKANNEFIPHPSLNITVVSDTSMIYLRSLCAVVGCSPPNLVFAADPVQHIAATPGALGVVLLGELKTWSLSTVTPLLNTTEGMVLTRPFAEGYPFVWNVQWALNEGTDGCEEMRVKAEFMKWSLESSAAAVLLNEMELRVVNGTGPAAVAALRCRGNPIFPVDTSDASFTMWYIIIGVCSACLVVMGIFLWNTTKERRRMRALFSANHLAALTAEAVAQLDFDTLSYLDELENPDRIQSALKNIRNNMREFVKYIPQQVIRAVQQEDRSEEDIFFDLESESNTSTVQHSSKTSGQQTHDLLCKRLERTTRNVVVLVIRRLELYSEVGDLTHQAMFLEEVIPIVERNNGTLHRLAEDSIVASWGAMGGTFARSRSLNVALKAVQGDGVVCGIQSGQALCGSLGTDSVRFFNILGGVVTEAFVFSYAAQGLRCGVVVGDGISEDMSLRYYVVPFLPMKMAQGTAGCGLLLDHKKVLDNAEWMYELSEQINDESLESDLVKAMTCMGKDDLIGALDLLRVIRNTPTPRLSFTIDFLFTMVSQALQKGSVPSHAVVTTDGTIFATYGSTCVTPSHILSP